MKRLELIGLQCEKTTLEAIDEIYLVADADNHSIGRIWSHSMDDGDNRSISWHWDFEEWIRIQLYEEDRVGSDEHIDTLTIHEENPATAYRNPYAFTGHHAVYRLFYRLIPQEDIGSTAEDATLVLLTLRCNDAQEATDEPYIVVNGVTQWGPENMKKRDTRQINRSVPFNGYARIELWEKDPSVSNLIDSHGVNYNVVGVGGETDDIPVQFNRGSGAIAAKYTLTYRVRR
jgi:hypothetical protein